MIKNPLKLGRIKFVFDAIIVLTIDEDLHTMLNQNYYKPVSFNRKTDSKIDKLGLLRHTILQRITCLEKLFQTS